MRGGLPALTVGEQGGFIGLPRPGDALEGAPRGTLALEGLSDCVFTLFAERIHLVGVDPP